MSPRTSAAAVDTSLDASLSFAPPSPPAPIDRPQPIRPEPDGKGSTGPARTPRRAERIRRVRPRIVVERETTSIPQGLATPGGLLGVMSEYPVQLSKVQPPPLREETLARERLLDWLAVKIHRRAVLLVAEAGYGKTTLLADFSRRTRLRILWFRLDRGDRDWVGFMAHLVAALRVHVPEFGAATSSLLRETASAAPPLNAVLDAFLRELAALPAEPSAFVFDDFHLVDDSVEIRHIARELLTRAPERVSFVFATRREPPIRIARLRALGEVAELGTDDLRFDASETERLFRETYDMRLEPAVLAELSRRTEGWAASLQLVRAALHDRNPAQVRAFVSSLSGAEGHLYDYLAEEVVADLDPDLQDFLMRTSLLETVDLTLGPVAAGRSPAETKRLMDEAELHGLLARGVAMQRHQLRAHPLVRDFLYSRLRRSVDADDVRLLHDQIAERAEEVDWFVSTRHYLAAGNSTSAARVLNGAIESVLATGSYAAAQDLVSEMPPPDPGGVAGLIVRSRVAQQRTIVQDGLELAELAFGRAPDSTAALVNLVTARTLAGDVVGALRAGSQLERSAVPEAAGIGRAFQLALQTSLDGALSTAISALDDLIIDLRKRGSQHFLGVALLNVAYLRISSSAYRVAKEAAEEAITVLDSTSRGIELISARLAKGIALAFLGDMTEARHEFSGIEESIQPGQRLEVAFEVGQLEALLGDAARAREVLSQVPETEFTPTDNGEQALLARALLFVREGDLRRAATEAAKFAPGQPRSAVSFEARRHLVRGLISLLASEEQAIDDLRKGSALAHRQGATLWFALGDFLVGLADSSSDPSRAVLEQASHPEVFSMAAEALLPRLKDLNPKALSAVDGEAQRRPERWLEAARRAVEVGGVDDRLAAGRLLEVIGTSEDVRRLRQASRSIRDRRAARLGHALAHRVAPRVIVEDLGRVYLLIGSRVVDGASLRRRVLALLCLLLSKPQFSATREEVLDALWPDLDPAGAQNSLNQTVYFLRRVFEPDYREDESPGYLVQDGETIWLNRDLIDSRSHRCVELLRDVSGAPAPEVALSLANEYKGKFALDFAYEDWTSAFRDHLHAAYLKVIEHAIRMDITSGHFARGTYVAQRACEVDPEAEGIQLALIRLYRHSDAHAAAAEQYAHYASSLRAMGLEPTPYAEL